MRQQAERDVAVPRHPLAHFVLVQTDLTLGLSEAFFDLPPGGADANQLLAIRLFRTVREEMPLVARVLRTAAHQEPTPHPDRARLGQLQAHPRVKRRFRGQSLAQVLRPFPPPLVPDRVRLRASFADVAAAASLLKRPVHSTPRWAGPVTRPQRLS